jgi:hypothetical protein
MVTQLPFLRYRGQVSRLCHRNEVCALRLRSHARSGLSFSLLLAAARFQLPGLCGQESQAVQRYRPRLGWQAGGIGTSSDVQLVAEPSRTPLHADRPHGIRRGRFTSIINSCNASTTSSSPHRTRNASRSSALSLPDGARQILPQREQGGGCAARRPGEGHPDARRLSARLLGTSWFSISCTSSVFIRVVLRSPTS